MFIQFLSVSALCWGWVKHYRHFTASSLCFSFLLGLPQLCSITHKSELTRQFLLCFFQDLLEALNQLEEGLKDNIKKLSSFDRYKQEVNLGRLDWSPMHKDPIFWRDNITNFEEDDFQVCYCKFFGRSCWFFWTWDLFQVILVSLCRKRKKCFFLVEFLVPEHLWVCTDIFFWNTTMYSKKNPKPFQQLKFSCD